MQTQNASSRIFCRWRFLFAVKATDFPAYTPRSSVGFHYGNLRPAFVANQPYLVLFVLKRTEVSINEQRQYKVTIQCDNQSRIEYKVLGKAGGCAKAMQESGERVRVLVDPKDEDHTLCLDLLLVFEKR